MLRLSVTGASVEGLGSELDALFALTPDAMVEARNALSVRLRKAGDTANAARVKGLKRPSPAAWALNQLHFHESGLLEQAIGEAERVRALHAQTNVDAQALRAAASAQRAAITLLVESGL